MAKDEGKFTISVLREDKVVYYGDCDVLFAPTVSGMVAILAHHTPMIAMLGSGDISIKVGRDKQTLATVTSGLLYVGENEATVLIDL